MKIKSPDKTYTGTSRYGSTVLSFSNGVAEHEGKLPPGVRLYLQGAGYGIDSEAETVKEEAPADPRDLTHEQLGTPLRDAAVDPRPEDFLPPVNAGKRGAAGNPHGPNVISPELHASQGARPVKEGPVEEAAEQEPAESAHADEPTFETAPPAGNASREAWHDYALTQGYNEEGLEGRTRDQLRALFD